MQSGSVPIPFNGPLSASAWATLAPGTIFPSASRAVASYTTQEFANLRHSGAQFIIDVTDVGASGTVTVKVQVFDPTSASWVDLPDAVTAVLGAVAATVLTVHPGVTDDANSEVSAALPNRWRLRATVAVDAVSFSVSGVYLP